MIRLKVTGMSCEHCVRAVSNALSGVERVERVVEVDLESGTAVVEGEPDVAALLGAVEDEGYGAEVTS